MRLDGGGQSQDEDFKLNNLMGDISRTPEGWVVKVRGRSDFV